MTTAADILSARKQSPTETIEQEVLAAIFYDNGVLPHIIDGYHGEVPPIDAAHFAGRATRRYLSAAWSLHRERRPVTPATILAELGAAATDQDRQLLQRIDDRAVPIAVSALPTHLRRIHQEANVRLLDQLLVQGAEELRQRPQDVESIAVAMQRRLTDVTMQRARRRDTSVTAIIDSGEHKKVVVGVPVGLAALDSLGDPLRGRHRMMGGLGRGEKLVITAIYGGGKTGTTVYLATQMMRPRRRVSPLTGEIDIIPPERVGYIMLDDNREVLTNWFISQLATAKLIQMKAPQREWFLNSRGSSEETMATKRQMEALIWAEGIVRRLPLHIIDAADGAHDFDTTIEWIRHACINEGVTTIVIDYIQDLTVKGVRSEDIRARVEAICMRLKPLFTELGSKYGLKLIALSQRPESANAYGAQGDTAGLAGGGALAQFANYVLQVQRFNDRPTAMAIKGLKMRTAARGVTFEYEIVPSNGYVTNPAWMPEPTALPVIGSGDDPDVVVGESEAADAIDVPPDGA